MTTKNKYAEKYFELFAERRTAMSNHFRKSQIAVYKFGQAIVSRLGLPENFETFDGKRAEPWVKFFEWDTPNNTIGDAVRYSDFDSVEPNGTLRFGLGLALSHAENSFPKTYFYMQCALLAHDDHVSLNLGGDGEYGVFEVPDQPGWDFSSAVDAFLLAIETLLKGPLFPDPQKPRPIGFIET